MVIRHTGHRHRDAKLVGRAEDQPDVLETERELEPGRAEGAPAHPFAVRLVDRRSEERSEEHTSELQSRFDLVCRLLLEKKKHEMILARAQTGIHAFI